MQIIVTETEMIDIHLYVPLDMMMAIGSAGMIQEIGNATVNEIIIVSGIVTTIAENLVGKVDIGKDQ